MPMVEQTTFQVVCDGPECYTMSYKAPSASDAAYYAEKDGFKQVGDKWLCPECQKGDED